MMTQMSWFSKNVGYGLKKSIKLENLMCPAIAEVRRKSFKMNRSIESFRDKWPTLQREVCSPFTCLLMVACEKSTCNWSESNRPRPKQAYDTARKAANDRKMKEAMSKVPLKYVQLAEFLYQYTKLMNRECQDIDTENSEDGRESLRVLERDEGFATGWTRVGDLRMVPTSDVAHGRRAGGTDGYVDVVERRINFNDEFKTRQSEYRRTGPETGEKYCRHKWKRRDWKMKRSY